MIKRKKEGKKKRSEQGDHEPDVILGQYLSEENSV